MKFLCLSKVVAKVGWVAYCCAQSGLKETVAASTTSLAELSRLAEDPSVSLQDRIAAAGTLAVSGDPRISIFAPKMLDIPGTTTHIGLAEGKLQETYDEFKGIGVHLSWIEKEVPRHEVSIASFRMAKYKVTNSEYHIYLQDDGAGEVPTSWSKGRFEVTQANHPVFTIGRQAALKYIEWLNGKTGRNFRLATEAEWEYAAAGPEELEYPWGNKYLPGHANTAEEEIRGTTPVGVFVNGYSPFGLSDMAGNVEEYVDGDNSPYPGGTQNPYDFFGATYAMTRGGAFNKMRDCARTKRRHGYYPGHAIGFRLAESVDSGESAL